MHIIVSRFLETNISKILILTVLYILTGKIGLMLAVPPGYATVIWPASGIAVGMLIIYGWRLWPGILIGSFILNSYISNAFSLEQGFVEGKALVALGIAFGSTVQALFGRWLVARFIGLPLALNHFKEIALLFLVTGPLSCLIAASIGVGILQNAGVILPNDFISNWSTWWMGDTIGVFVFLPLVLFAPGKQKNIRWRGDKIGVMPIFTILILAVPLGLTFYAWKIVSENTYQQNITEFNALSSEIEKALQHRMNSYDYALLGGVGYFEGSNFVSRKEWHNYAQKIDIKNNFPGINGIGYIESVLPKQIPNFIKKTQKDGAPDFKIHPETQDRPYYIIKYIEPQRENSSAVGLNIGFEDHRMQAADASRETGNPTITKRIFLVQDQEKTPGFLLLHPMYKMGMPINTSQERNRAFQGWIYAPFIAKNFFKELTQSQEKIINIRVYDGDEINPDTLIYNSDNSVTLRESIYSKTKTIEVMQQKWVLVWDSTLAYERDNQSSSAFFILIGGLVFTGLFGLFLMLALVRREETMEWMTEDRRFILPLTVFIVVALSSYYLYKTLQQREMDYVNSVVEAESKKIEQLIHIQASERLLALKRMAQRWAAAKGTPKDQWFDDASNYVGQVGGLTALEWVDPTYHVRWVHPKKGNEKAVGLNILFDDARKLALEGAAANNNVTITQPLDLIQGYKAFIAYAPINYDRKFDGFIAGIFSIDDIIKTAISKEASENFSISFSYASDIFYSNELDKGIIDTRWKAEKLIQMNDKIWILHIVPTQRFARDQLSNLPNIIFIAGLLIAALLSITVRYIILARLKSNHLMKSNKLNEAILSNASYLIIATDKNGRIILFNESAVEILGYKANEVIGFETPSLWHDPEEVATRSIELSNELGRDILPGFKVFTTIPDIEEDESREWTFINRSGRRFPVNLTVSLLKDGFGNTTGYLGIAEDISERVRQQNALAASEETFRSAMEHAPIGMALVDLEGKFLLVNQALCEILGYSEQKLLNIDFQSITHPDDLGTDMDNLNQMMVGRIQRYQMEKRYFHRDGSLVWINLNVSIARDNDNQPKHFIAQIQDITKQKEIDSIKSEFISVVSHELRTPLTSIRGSLGLIAGTMGKDLPEKAMGLINIAYKNSERLILLINDILDLDKIAAGQMHFDMQTHNVADLIQSGIEANTAYAEKYKVRISAEPISDKLAIKVDAGRWQQVFSNLLSNAIKFSPEGDKVKIHVLVKNGKVRISIEDHGDGIPEEFLERIFTKFSQADSTNARNKGGTGLGLSISKEIVIQMNGDIDFDSVVGKGSVFWFEFALVDQRDQALPVMGSAQNEDLPLLLHIEDDTDLSEVIAMALQDYARVKSVTSLYEAKDVLTQGGFSLIVLDIGMPDGSGLSILNHLETLGNQTPVIVLSADETPNETRKKVVASLVKARVSEIEIIDTIVNFLNNTKKD